MDALEAIRSRRSIKKYTGDPVPEETLRKLVDAAYSGPSGANKCPWEFVVVTDRALLDRLAEAHQYCGWLRSAQAAIVIVANSANSRYWLEDCSAAAENIWIAATALGMGVAWSAIYLSDDADETAKRETVVREAASIPSDLRAPIVLGIGVPASEPGERKRPELGQIVHWGKYGNHI